MADIPWGVIGPVLAVILVIDLVLLLDLRRRDVVGLPKVAWGVIIVVVSFPIGALVYWVAGRVPPGQTAPPEDAPPVPPPPGSGTVVTEPRDAGAETSLPREDIGWQPEGPLALSTTGLRKVYDVAAVDGVDLRVPKGAVYGLIGPNGAGKTTLLDLIAGLRTPTAGRIDLAVDRQRMAVLPDTPSFEPWLSGREVVDLARHLIDPGLPDARVRDVLEEVDLVDAADRRTGGYSRGMLQRLGLATCLVGDPELLVLDEPSSALDPAGRRGVLDLVGRLAGERTVVLSTHVLSDVQQVCDTVGVLQEGRLVFQGPIDELLARTSSVFRLRVAPDDHVVDVLRRTPWVADVTQESAGGYRIVVADVAAAEEGMPGVLADAGARLRAFGPATDLEAAFLELTDGRP